MKIVATITPIIAPINTAIAFLGVSSCLGILLITFFFN